MRGKAIFNAGGVRQMKIIVINASDTYEYRVNLLYRILKKQQHEVTVITSDYMHIEKRRRTSLNNDFIYLNTVAYKKNMSFARLYSHYKFAKDAYQYIRAIDIDLLYILVPPNSLARIAKYCKEKNEKVKIVIDIIDMWPESIPIQYTNHFPFTIWANMRNKSLKFADYIVTECNLYKEKLQKYLGNRKVYTVYWVREDEKKDMDLTLDKEKYHLCYLGSVNNIIDIFQIGEIIRKFKKRKPVVLKIIGGGERMNELIDVATEAGAEVFNYGKIYDSEKKQQVFNSCHYGLNIMKDTVCVGLSMKSIEYFGAGLPVINNLSGDTEKIVKEYQCGFNWNGEIIKYDESMRKKSRLVFDKYFNINHFERQIMSLLEEVEDDRR